MGGPDWESVDSGDRWGGAARRRCGEDAPTKWPMQQDRQRGLALAPALSDLGHQGILAPGGRYAAGHLPFCRQRRMDGAQLTGSRRIAVNMELRQPPTPTATYPPCIGSAQSCCQVCSASTCPHPQGAAPRAGAPLFFFPMCPQHTAKCLAGGRRREPTKSLLPEEEPLAV